MERGYRMTHVDNGTLSEAYEKEVQKLRSESRLLTVRDPSYLKGYRHDLFFISPYRESQADSPIDKKMTAWFHTVTVCLGNSAIEDCINTGVGYDITN
jgi:hypothetical protein